MDVVVGLTVPIVARVVFDGAFNPAMHNLWPIEMLIAILIGSAAAMINVLLGSLALRMSRAEPEDQQSGKGCAVGCLTRCAIFGVTGRCALSPLS